MRSGRLGTGVKVPEQRQIVAHLDNKLAVAKRIVARLETQIVTLAACRKSLIHECVTGQWRITEADVRRAGGSPPASGSLHSARTP